MVKRIRQTADSESEKNKLEAESNLPKNRVKLIIEATRAAADISYPTDLGLLNGSRQHTEKIRDTLYEPVKGQVKKKPRTYRLKARKDYLKVAKQLRPSRNQKRKTINKQLQYIKRNLSDIEQLKELGADLGSLNKRQYKMWLVVTEVEG
jgi:IS5 family transposase